MKEILEEANVRLGSGAYARLYAYAPMRVMCTTLAEGLAGKR